MYRSASGCDAFAAWATGSSASPETCALSSTSSVVGMAWMVASRAIGARSGPRVGPARPGRTSAAPLRFSSRSVASSSAALDDAALDRGVDGDALTARHPEGDRARPGRPADHRPQARVVAAHLHRAEEGAVPADVREAVEDSLSFAREGRLWRRWRPDRGLVPVDEGVVVDRHDGVLTRADEVRAAVVIALRVAVFGELRPELVAVEAPAHDDEGRRQR